MKNSVLFVCFIAFIFIPPLIGGGYEHSFFEWMKYATTAIAMCVVVWNLPIDWLPQYPEVDDEE